MKEVEVDYISRLAVVLTYPEGRPLPITQASAVLVPEHFEQQERGEYMIAALLYWARGLGSPHVVRDWDIVRCSPTELVNGYTGHAVYQVEQGNSGSIAYVSLSDGGNDRMFAILDDFGEGRILARVGEMRNV